MRALIFASLVPTQAEVRAWRRGRGVVGGGAVLGAAGGGAPECAPGLRAGDIAAQDRAPAEPGSYNKRGGSSIYDPGHDVLIALVLVLLMLSFDIESFSPCRILQD